MRGISTTIRTTKTSTMRRGEENGKEENRKKEEA